MPDSPKFAGKWRGVEHRDPAPKSLAPAPGGRRIDTSQLTVRSVPMGAGGGVPLPDAELEAMKAALAVRTGQLYNKGGPQYMTDADLQQMKTGAHMRRN